MAPDGYFMYGTACVPRKWITREVEGAGGWEAESGTGRKWVKFRNISLYFPGFSKNSFNNCSPKWRWQVVQK